MDLPVNVGHLRQVQTFNDAETRAIHGVMIQKREAVKCIEDEIARLVENKRGLEEDLVRLGVTLAPHNHRLLPNEVLSRIFILLALDYGTVHFPIPKNDAPPQLAISYVCSHWRRVALRTPELWGDTHVFFPTTSYPRDYIYFHQRWVLRARTLPVTRLSIAFDGLQSTELASALRNILLLIQVKRLSLRLTYTQLMALSTIPETALSRLSEFDVEIAFPDRNMDINMSDPHPLITRLRSATFRMYEAGPWIDQLRLTLPWSQLQSLNIELYDEGSEHLIVSILRQIPMLEVLSLQIFDVGVLEQLTMPSLKNLTMTLVKHSADVDNILRSFMFPSLTEFTLCIGGGWTCETFDIFKQQYNMQGLREATFFGAFALPVSSLLRDAPMLHSLSLRNNAIMDEEALIGVANGTLGRFLTRLEINIPYDVGEVLDMVEARKKMVDGLIRNGCSWREEITGLRDVVIHTDVTDGKGYKKRITALKEAGIRITVS